VNTILIRTLTVAGLVTAVVGVSSAPALAATTSFSSFNTAASVSKNTVTVKTTVKASRAVTVQEAGICVRDKNGANKDFTRKSRVALSNRGIILTGTQNLPSGTYSYFPCVKYNNKWWNGATQKFTIGSVTTQPTPAPTPTPTPTQNPAPSTAMPVGDLPGWKQNYKQDFTQNATLGQVGNVYGMSMRGYDGFTDTSKKGLYAPDKVLSVSNGSLNYYLHTENGTPLVATPVLNDYAGQKYGRYSVRFRSDTMPGYKIAFLLWPSSDDWNEGEIDWPEGSLGEKMRPASAVPGTYNNGSMLFQPEKEYFTPTDSSDWHTATTEWTPTGVKFYWDGQLVAQTDKAVPQTNFRWTLQAETELTGSKPDAKVAGNLQVDWATSYSYAP
jgi:hypothetical protein